jgi:hypothetical protein
MTLATPDVGVLRGELVTMDALRLAGLRVTAITDQIVLILRWRAVAQVGEGVVRAVIVEVPDFLTIRARAEECQRYQLVNLAGEPDVLILGQDHLHVAVGAPELPEQLAALAHDEAGI